MTKYDSEYPEHPQHGLYEDEDYEEGGYESSRWWQRVVIGVIALILVVVMVLSMVAQVQ